MIDPRMMRTKPLTPEKPQRTAGYKWVPATDEEFAEVLERYSERMAIVIYEGNLSELKARGIAINSIGKNYSLMKLVRA